MSKGLEALERNKYEIENADDFILIKKELKALEIIKKKKVNVSALLELDNLEQYNGYCAVVGDCKYLTREQYDLLKEVLL